MKNIISTFCAILMPLLCSAAVNLLSLTAKPGIINYSVAKNLLPVAYLHNPQLLPQATVEIIKSETCGKAKAIICSVTHDDIATEYYLVTISTKHGMVVDGAMLGHNGDSEILKMKFPHDEMVYQPSPNISFEFSGDTIKVLRTYNFFTTAKGGNWFYKEGTICNPFVVSSSGKIEQLHPTTSAIRTDGDANYLSKDHKQPTRSMTEGEYFPIGMSVLTMAQTPASNSTTPKELNKDANKIAKIVEQYKEKGGDPPENPETLSVIEFAVWSFNLGMRNSTEFLTWVAKNPKEDLSKFFIVVASQNDSNELQWLKDNVKKLKDKKARKWWEKWIKNNI